MIDHQGMQPAQKLSPAEFTAFVQKQLSLARRVVMVYEAGPYGLPCTARSANWGWSVWSVPLSV